MPKDHTKAADLMGAMQAEFQKLFPNEPLENLRVDKSLLTAVSLSRGDVAAAVKEASRATLTTRDIDRISRHDPRDQE